MSAVRFYSDRRKTKKRTNVQAKLLVGDGKNRLIEASDGEIIKLVDNSVSRNAKTKTLKI